VIRNRLCGLDIDHWMQIHEPNDNSAAGPRRYLGCVVRSAVGRPGVDENFMKGRFFFFCNVMHNSRPTRSLARQRSAMTQAVVQGGGTKDLQIWQASSASDPTGWADCGVD